MRVDGDHRKDRQRVLLDEFLNRTAFFLLMALLSADARIIADLSSR
jgi:hypothetical protein